MSTQDDTSEVKSVRAREVISLGNSRPIPMMRNVTIIPNGSGKICTRDCLPDTGCTQSLISEDIVLENSMRVDTRMKKRIKAVNDQKLECSGGVMFTAEYEGRSTVVSALVSSSIQDKVLLSWRALVELGVIPSTFPHVEERVAGVTASNPMVQDKAESNVKAMITTFDDVFDEGGTMRTMKGKPMVIHLKENIPIIPLHICSPRKPHTHSKSQQKRNLMKTKKRESSKK